MTQPAVIRLPAFWAATLGYVVEDNHELIERLLSAGAIPQDTVVTSMTDPHFGHSRPYGIQTIRFRRAPWPTGSTARRCATC
jgi:hypothetical protein